jgi:hypothetical protein
VLDQHRHRRQRNHCGRQHGILQQGIQESALAALELAEHRDLQALLPQALAQVRQPARAGRGVESETLYAVQGSVQGRGKTLRANCPGFGPADGKT